MSTVTLYDLGTMGIYQDLPAHLMPPEAWSAGQNVRFIDGYAQRNPGYASAINPVVMPGFILNVPSATDSFWLYASKTKVRGYSGGTDQDVTRLAGDYAAVNFRDWNGCILGGIPVINNGVDVPQYWPTITLGTKLAALPNWTSTLRAKMIKNFGKALVAVNLNDNGTLLPHAVQWSHPADPGSVPPSWSLTDTTKDSGRTHLTDIEGGDAVGMQLLGNLMIIYKERSAHSMRFIGGQDVYAFDLLFGQGALTSRSYASIDSGNKHFVVGADDIYVHSGNKNLDYPLDEKARRALYAEIDPDNLLNSFCFDNPLYEEACFCYPTLGSTYPNKMMAWNYRKRTIGFKKFDGISVDVGALSTPGPTWNDLSSTTWDNFNQPWNTQGARRMLAASVASNRIWSLDSGFNYGDATNTVWSLQRTGLAIVGKNRAGEPKADYTSNKLFKRIWPKYKGSGLLEVRLGSQDEINGTVQWAAFKTFDPSLKFLDFEVNGRLGAVEIKSSSDADGRLEGYDLEFDIVGGQ